MLNVVVCSFLSNLLVNFLRRRHIILVTILHVITFCKKKHNEWNFHFMFMQKCFVPVHFQCSFCYWLLVVFQTCQFHVILGFTVVLFIFYIKIFPCWFCTQCYNSFNVSKSWKNKQYSISNLIVLTCSTKKSNIFVKVLVR